MAQTVKNCVESNANIWALFCRLAGPVFAELSTLNHTKIVFAFHDLLVIKFLIYRYVMSDAMVSQPRFRQQNQLLPGTMVAHPENRSVYCSQALQALPA